MMTVPPPHQVVVSVAADGTVTARTVGITGSTCLDSIAVLEELFDATTVASEYTHEYTQTAAVRQERVVEVGDDVHQR